MAAPRGTSPNSPSCPGDPAPGECGGDAHGALRQSHDHALLIAPDSARHADHAAERTQSTLRIDE